MTERLGMIYKDIVEKAAKKAIKELFRTLKVSDRYGRLNRPEERRYWKNKYLRKLWRLTFLLGNKESGTAHDNSSLNRTDIAASLQSHLHERCMAMGTQSWTGVKLPNHSYIISDAGDGIYITAYNTDAQRSLMSAEDTAQLMIAFDAFLNNWEQEIDDAMLAYSAEKQAALVLKMTASVILEDILAENEGVYFKMKLQKNGRLRCNIISQASWLPDKVFRTTWETLREDFTAALKDYYIKQRNRY